MMDKAPFIDSNERRRLTRVKTDLRINYQIIARTDALKDPYDANFAIPRYYLMLAQVNDIETVFNLTKDAGSQLDPKTLQLMDLLNQKINVISNSFYDTVIESFLPNPTRVDVSESGISFYALDHLKPGSHLHLSLSRPNSDFCICTTVRVVYSEDEDLEGFKTGAYFISLHPRDREKLAQIIDETLQQDFDFLVD